MLQITIPKTEWYDESKEEFVNTESQTLNLEHSLISISKWEAKWKKPFISEKEKTVEETLDYIKCMTMSPNVNPNIYMALSVENIKSINEYIDDPMSATTFSNRGSGSINRQVITSELIYAWMIELNIPPEYQKWHLNRLLNLIRICDIRRTPPKKMGKNEILQRNRELNEARKKKLKTRG